MRRLLRTWGVSGAAWLGVLVIAGAAVAASLESPDLELTLSPKGAVSGKTIDSGEPFEMTLHLAAAPDETYSLAVSYAGDSIGTCAGADQPVSLETNPQGKAVWTCELPTATNEGEENLTGAIVFAVGLDDAAVGELTANISVRPAEQEEAEDVAVEEQEEEEQQEESETGDGVNHGHCVSYWARESKAQGLEGRWRGGFISSIASNPEAVAPKGEPGSECDFQDELDEAKQTQQEEQAQLAGASADRKPARAAKKSRARD